MRKKVTSKKPSTQEGIGYINNSERFLNLYTTLVKTIGDFADTSLNTQEKVNSTKNFVDALVGRSRGNYTKTDVYQILFLASLGAIQNAIGEVPFTKVNTVVAKLTTEGQYGNTGVVRRQTTLEKFRELFSRVFNIQIQDDSKLRRMANSTWDSNTRNIASAGNFLTFIVSLSQRGQRGTTTTRVSNRTRRTTSTPARTTTPSTPARTTSTPASTSDAFGGGDRNNIFTLSIVDRETQVKAWYLASSGVANNTRAEQVGYVVLIFRYFLHESVSRLTDSAKVNITEILRVFMRLDVVANNLYSDRDINRGQLDKISDTIRVLAFVFSRYKIIKAKKMTPLLRGYTKSQIVSLTISTVGQNDTTEIDRTVYSAFYNRGDRQYRDAIAMINRMRESRVGVNPSEAKKFLNGGQVMLSYIPRVLLWPPYSSSTETTTTTTTRTAPAQTSVTQTQVARNSTPTTSDRNAVQGDAISTLVRDAKFKNTLGIEIEYYGASFRELKEGFRKAKVSLYPYYLRYHQSCNYDKFKDWRIMSDSSIRDRFGRSGNRDADSGEVVSPILVGEKGLLTLVRVLNAMKLVGVTNNNSTGLHIHLGIKTSTNPNGMTYQALRNFICNYIGFEKIIDAYVRPTRRQNIHSTYTPSPIVDIWRDKKVKEIDADGYERETGEIKAVTYSEIKELSDRLNAMTDSEFRNWATSTLRRGKINPHSNGLAFSFEIRQHGGTIEKDTILGWIMFMHYLCELSKKRLSKSFTWNNLEKDVLPKSLSAFWENRIVDMTGQIPDKFDGPRAR